MSAATARRLDLRQPDLWRMAGDSALAAVSMGGQMVVEGWLVYTMTGSSLGVGTLYAIHFLPLAPVGLAAGTLSDRIDRRVLLRWIEALFALDFGIFALLVASGAIALWHIYALTFVSGCAFAMYFPVRAAYIHDLVGNQHVVSGLGLLHVAARSGELLGALAAGFVIERAGAAGACLLLSGSNCTAFLVLGGLRTPGLSRGMRTSSLRETLRESATELRTNRTLLALILVAVSVEIFAFSYWTALPEVATQRLGMDAEGLSYLNAARALGGLAAGIALAWTIDLRRGRAYLCVIFGFGVSLIFFASAPTLLACALAVLCLGALESGVDVLNQGMMQACVPDALRGRAMGAWSLAIGVAPLGNLQMGTLAAHFGAGTALQIHGAALLGVAALAALWIPRLRRL